MYTTSKNLTKFSQKHFEERVRYILKNFFHNQLFPLIVACVIVLTGSVVTSAQDISPKNVSVTMVDSLVSVPPAAGDGVVVNPASPSIPHSIDVSWGPLLEKLRKDVPSKNYDKYFTELEPYSSAPMSLKVKELYTVLTRPPRPPRPSGLPPVEVLSVYKGFVTAETVNKCKEFLARNKRAFDLMEERYHVPRATVVSLLFVETKLGTFLGKEKAFWSLACMAMADTPEMVHDGIASLNIQEKYKAWLKTRLKDKSSWAYAELKALLAYAEENSINPQSIPGSAYGAIGICQFMPSNIPLYGDDGTGNGKIDLFSEPDAVVSVGKFFAGHGWKGLMTEDKKKKVIKRYNNLNRYANTILALSNAITTGKIPHTTNSTLVVKKKTPAKVKNKRVKNASSKGNKKQSYPSKSVSTKKIAPKKMTAKKSQL